MTIYLDLDGVLADFVGQTNKMKIPNNSQWYDPKDKWTRETWEGEIVKNIYMATYDFWYTMPMCPDAKTLWDFCEPLGRAVLTAKPSPYSPDVVAQGKFDWVHDNLGPHVEDDFICCNREDKAKYAKGNVLVDDDPRNCKAWEDAGGFAIYHPYKFEKQGDSLVCVEHGDVGETINKIKGHLNG